jgi:hypothetical protein
MLSDAMGVYIDIFAAYESDFSDSMSPDSALALGEILLRGERYEAAQLVFAHALDRLGEDRFALAEDMARAHAGLASAYVLDGKPDLASENCDAVRRWTHAATPVAQVFNLDVPEIPKFIWAAPVYPWHLVMTEVEG